MAGLIPALPVAGRTLALEISGVAGLAQLPGSNHTLTHTGAPCSSACRRRRTWPVPIVVQKC